MSIGLAAGALAVACAVLLLSIITGISYYIAWLVTRAREHTYWDEYTFLPSDLGMPYEAVSFVSGDGITLAAWHMIQTQATATIILGSGYRDRKMSVLPIAARLWQKGFSIFLLDFRNQGDSDVDTAHTMGQREVRDLLAAVDEVVRRCPGTAIGAMGYSMGGVVSILAAAADRRIGAVVSDCAYAAQSNIIIHNMTFKAGRTYHLPAFPFVPLAEWFIDRRAGYRPSNVRPEDAIGRIAPRPVLIIHGAEDDLCPVDNAYRLFERAGAPKELWIVPNAKHTGAYWIDRDRYIARVAAFFQKSLSATDNAERVLNENADGADA